MTLMKRGRDHAGKRAGLGMLLGLALLSAVTGPAHGAAITLTGFSACGDYPGGSGLYVFLNWNRVTPTPVNYVIYRSPPFVVSGVTRTYITVAGSSPNYPPIYFDGSRGLSPNTSYQFYIAMSNTAFPDPNSPLPPDSNILTVTTGACPDRDIGLRYFNGSQVVRIAAEMTVPPTSKLRIHKNGTTYGIILVDRNDPNASKIIVNTGSGPKALKKLP